MVSSGSNSNISYPPQFRFITITERPASHKNDVSHTIRSHVMLSSLHQKRIGKSSKGLLRPAEYSGTENKTPKQLSGKFKLATWSRKSRRKVVAEEGLIDQIVGLKEEFGTSKNLKERVLEAPQCHKKVRKLSYVFNNTGTEVPRCIPHLHFKPMAILSQSPSREAVLKNYSITASHNLM